MRIIVINLFLVMFSAGVYAQQDSVPRQRGYNVARAAMEAVDSLVRDSVTKANRQQFLADSIGDKYLVADSLRENLFVTNVYRHNLSYPYKLSFKEYRPRFTMQSGTPRKYRKDWVIAAIIGLFIYTALLNIFLGNDIRSVFRSFYDKLALAQLDKEGALINSWAFIGLFILFSLTFGMVLYQVTDYYDLYYGVSGFQLFITFSFFVALLFTLKFLVLKFLGFIFDINSMVSQYITILNLTYFNVAFVLLVVAACCSLMAERFIPLLMFFTIGLVAVIFAWQYIRNSVNIISNFRFHKFYLFIYLCALEICPVLILIKSLNV